MRPATGNGPPRYQEIMQAISADISSGRVALGERLPVEQDLCARHNVGRHTIREAIRGLVELGMVERRPRVGTSVISSEPIVGYHSLPASTDDIAGNIRATRIVRPRGTVIEADEATARRLGCDVGARWFRFSGARILRDRSSQPLCFSEHYVQNTPKARRAIAMATQTLAPGALAHQEIEQEIRAAFIDDEQATALRAEPDSPALVLIRRHRDPDGRLAAILIHTHTADRFSISMKLPPGNRR